MIEMGIDGRILATDITISSPAFQMADMGLLVPMSGGVEYIPRLLEYVEKHSVKLLVPLTDVDLRALARHRDEFTQRGCTVMVGSEELVMLCRDKAQINSLLRSAGLRGIKTVGLKEFWAKPFYPCFVKPTHGSAGVGTRAVNDEKELRHHIAIFGGRLIVQEYIEGQEFTIDIYRDRSGQVRCVVPRQRLVVRSGEVEKGLTVMDKGLMDGATRLAGLLGDVWGVLCCQCRRKSPKASPRFFEINLRFGGGAPLSVAAGANLPRYVLEEVLGQPISATMGTFVDKLLMLRYDAAVYVKVDNVKSLPGLKTPLFR